MRIMTILGTRPEIIRLSLVIQKLDKFCNHILVHTGQNFTPTLNDIFFKELELRPPDHYLGVRGDTFGEQISQIIASSERVINTEKPDRILILGDTNSALTAIVSKRLSIPVYHMEAGNRCYDDRVPEEVNRRIIDHSSDVLLPYTERSRQNLLREGIASEQIYVTGNPIFEVIQHYNGYICQSKILSQLGLEAGKYFLITMHRAENVDIESRLLSLYNAFDRLQQNYGYPVIVSTHPRTRQRIQLYQLSMDNAQMRFMEPFGFFDFITLERQAFCVLSDSGTVQEECAIFGVPNVTIRDVTERPETIECGSNILSGANTDSILHCVHIALGMKGAWKPPKEYSVENVSDTVLKILLGYFNKK